MDLDDLIGRLQVREGIAKVHVSIEVSPVVRRTNTGEYDDSLNPIRERVVSEADLDALADDIDWHYNPSVDLISDHRIEDRFSKRYTVDTDNNDD
jgi:hypothetical protein